MMPDEFVGTPGVINDSYLEYVRPLAGLIARSMKEV